MEWQSKFNFGDGGRAFQRGSTSVRQPAHRDHCKLKVESVAEFTRLHLSDRVRTFPKGL
jgi:hypothetical protein